MASQEVEDIEEELDSSLEEDEQETCPEHSEYQEECLCCYYAESYGGWENFIRENSSR